MQASISFRRHAVGALALLGVPALGALAPAAFGGDWVVPRPPRVGAERGIAILQCTSGPNIPLQRTRGAIVELGIAAPSGDVVLTAAHGLPPTPDAVLRECKVFAGGRRHKIAKAWLGRDSDWAVVLTKRPLRGEIVRLDLAAPERRNFPRLEDGTAVRLLRLTLHEDCRVETEWLPSSDATAGFFLYSCKGRPGLSGSPIVVQAADRPVLIGFHLGRRWRSDGHPSHKRQSFARRIDAAIVAALQEAAQIAGAHR